MFLTHEEDWQWKEEGNFRETANAELQLTVRACATEVLS